MHGDHFLHGPFLKEKYGAEAWTLDKIVDRCENPRRYDYAALVSAYGDGFDGMKIDKAFQDGESITWEGYKIQVDWLPGQTEFGCCLWLDIDDKRIAFTGDNLFGDPRDRSQTAHDCVVARNSAILAEGHVYGSQYLLKLNPDIIMAAHSYVMPDPQELLQRYHAWSKDMQAAFQQMLSDQDYEYLFDPYWVSAYPYRIDLSDGKPHDVMITVRNFRNQHQHHRVELILPEGVRAQPKLLVGVQMIPLNITLDGKQYGTFAEEVWTYDPEREQAQTMQQMLRVMIVAALTDGQVDRFERDEIKTLYLDLTGLPLTDVTLDQEIDFAMEAKVTLCGFVSKIVNGLSGHGRALVVKLAYCVMSSAGDLTPEQDNALIELGDTLGIPQDQFLELLKHIRDSQNEEFA
ncbi:gloB_2 [Symbiodinium sp. KB8]|nr:gloB_2 [Symbiodinium sp. KB8]